MKNPFSALLVHRYVATTTAAGTPDAWGDTPRLTGATATRRCWLDREPVLRTDALGRVEVNAPRLLIAPGDPLAPDDLVGDVTSRRGEVLLAGPNTVETVEPMTLLGGVVVKAVRFRGAVVR